MRGSQRNSAVRLAIYGCGGRGTGVAESFIANTSAHLTALGDLFPDPLARAKDRLDTASAKGGKPSIDKAQQFQGVRSLDELLDSKTVDAVYIPSTSRKQWPQEGTFIARSRWASIRRAANEPPPRAPKRGDASAWPSGSSFVMRLHMSTQFIEGGWDVAMRYFGTEGNAEMKYDAPVRITGRRPWDAPGIGIAGQNAGQAAATGAFKGAIEDADAMKERHWIDSIVSGKFINEAAQGAESGLSAILGRTVTWDEAANSNEAWDARLDVQKM